MENKRNYPIGTLVADKTNTIGLVLIVRAWYFYVYWINGGGINWYDDTEMLTKERLNILWKKK